MTETLRALLENMAGRDVNKAEAAELSIVAAGPRIAPDLQAAYQAGSLSASSYFTLLLKIGPAAYKPMLPLLRGEDAEAFALLGALEYARVSAPEAVPYLVEGLRSDNWNKVMRVMDTVLHLHPCVEIHDPAQLSLFAEAVPPLLDLLDHNNEHTRAQAANCLAVIRPSDLPTLSRLCLKLDAELDAGCNMSYTLVRAIESYAPTATEAIPVLKKALLFQGYLYARVAAAEALAKFGDAAVDAIPLLEQIRDTTPFQTKSDAKQFQTSIQKAIKKLQKCKAPAAKKVKSAQGDPYLLALIGRMSAPDDSIYSSHTSTSGKAHEEARHLSDPELIPKIAELFNGSLKSDAFHKLSFALGWLVRNTQEQRGRDLIVDLLGRKDLSAENRNALIYAAEASRTLEVLPIAQKLLLEDHDSYASSVLSYFGKMKDEGTVDDVGRLLRLAPGSRLMAILTLLDIGSPKAIPYLMEMARRDLTSRRKDEKEWRYYAHRALAKIGDRSIVPELLALLEEKRYGESWREVVLSTLGSDGIYRSMLEHLTSIISGLRSAEPPSATATGIVMVLDYFRKVQKDSSPEVVDALQQLQNPSIFDRLPKEDQRYIDDYGSK